MPLRLIAAVLALSAAALPAEEPQPEPPRVALTNPLAIPARATTKVVIRGWRLDQVTEVQASGEAVTVKLLKAEAAAPPNQQKPEQVGDTQVILEITTPAESAPAQLELTLISEAGKSPPRQIAIGGRFPSIAEKEPNNGFEKAQPIQGQQIIEAQIDQQRDVDVFAFDGLAGQQVVAQVQAARLGSGLDSMLWLYDADLQLVAFSDDLPETSDSRIEVTLPDSGRYFLTVMDAHDQGGPAHPYRLIVEATPTE